jgi:ABC-type transport system involved in cytochrome c biogenesis permease subunit
MYESVIWVAFGTMLFALIFEAIYRTRYILIGSVPVAVVALILADSQPVALDRSIQPLVPVLQSNFWLTTHVLTITLSYAAFLLAVGVAHLALGMVMARKKPSPELYNYIYRTLQVGVMLLATGTILGGVWANYSWGRFWDWDPKETWALVALLAYLFLLHGRIAGRWGGFGLAVGSILGFITIVMAWYGVNFVLGVGLHSYGFGSGGFGQAIAYVVFELAFVAFAVFRKYTAPKSAGKTSAPQMAS